MRLLLSKMMFYNNTFPFNFLYGLEGKVSILGDCQRPVSSLGMPQYMHKIINLWKFGLIWSSKLQENNQRIKTPVKLNWKYLIYTFLKPW